jgi:2-haloacid dehalogenase
MTAPTVVFDLGGVLVDWDPRPLYRKLIADDAERERFLTEVCTMDWHSQHDAGRSMTETVPELVSLHPEHRELIEAWRDRFTEMLPGALTETVAILEDVVALGQPVYALTNWSAEIWPVALERFPFIAWFDGVVVSGHEGTVKPEKAIFDILVERYDLDRSATVFIDDWDRNVDGARAAGLQAIQFTDASRLRGQLRDHGVPL